MERRRERGSGKGRGRGGGMERKREGERGCVGSDEKIVGLRTGDWQTFA